MLRTIFDPYSDLFLEYIETTKKNDMQTNHYHDTYELFFVVKGIRYIFLDGVCHVLNPGDIILIKPYQTHYMQSLSSDFYARYVLNFAPDYLDGMLKPAEKQRFLEVLQNDILHLTTEQSGELVEVFERLRKYYNRHDAVAEKLKQNYCLELLLLCRDYYTRQERTQMPELSAAPRQEILDAIAYINAHYAEKIDLETIASQILFLPYFPRGDRSHRSGIPYQCPADQSRKTSGGIFSGDPGDRAEDRICVIGAFFQNLPKCLWCQSQ